jgi:hypothetical protein
MFYRKSIVILIRNNFEFISHMQLAQVGFEPTTLGL